MSEPRYETACELGYADPGSLTDRLTAAEAELDALTGLAGEAWGRYTDLDRDLFVVVEQDMYPADFDKPRPIAQRTYTYLRGLGIGDEE